jgi:hypothetical protein
MDLDFSPYAYSVRVLKTVKITPHARNASRIFVIDAINQGFLKNATDAENLSAVPLCTHYRFVCLASINLNCQ